MAKLGIRTVTIAPSLFDTNMGRSAPDKARQALESMLEFPPRFGNAAEFGHMAKSLIENTYANGEVYFISGASRLGKL
jgi:NAD(P)-dependent dehydrogenase (short-subunit alcohol dehydrogenase family)